MAMALLLKLPESRRQAFPPSRKSSPLQHKLHGQALGLLCQTDIERNQAQAALRLAIQRVAINYFGAHLVLIPNRTTAACPANL
jgi:hypothetical protein